jgi:hypothetical protein
MPLKEGKQKNERDKEGRVGEVVTAQPLRQIILHAQPFKEGVLPI